MRALGRHRRGVRAATVVVGLVLAVLPAACGGQSAAPGDGSIITTTTAIGGVDIVEPTRRFDAACGVPSTPDPGQQDVTRIAVADPALLDAICALGLQSKVVAVAADRAGIPAYLGPSVTSLPTIGTQPSAAIARDARADVVLGHGAEQNSAFGSRSVVVDATANWRDQFQAVADGLGRSAEGRRRLDVFAADARRAGTRVDASHTQVSLVQFGADDERLAGTASFAGSILAAMGVQRPAPQRVPGPVPVTEDNFDDADGDLIYVGFDSPAAQQHGTSVLRSDRWLDMGAPSSNRVNVVNSSVWFSSGGLAAAPVVLDDVRRSLNGYSPK